MPVLAPVIKTALFFKSSIMSPLGFRFLTTETQRHRERRKQIDYQESTVRIVAPAQYAA
jgi:hypothetical protein